MIVEWGETEPRLTPFGSGMEVKIKNHVGMEGKILRPCEDGDPVLHLWPGPLPFLG